MQHKPVVKREATPNISAVDIEGGGGCRGDRLRCGAGYGKGGKEIWIQAAYNPIRDLNGRVYKVVKFATDITEQKLKSADDAGKLNAISRAQAVIEFTPKGEILTANENFLSTLGYQLSDVQGKHHAMFCEQDYADYVNKLKDFDNSFDSWMQNGGKQNG